MVRLIAPGLVAVPCLELVYSVFALTLARLAQRLPLGSQIAFDSLGGQIDNKRNQLIETWLLPVPALEWVLFVDSDQRVPADVVERLLAHDVPIVGATITKKRQYQVVVRPFPDLVHEDTPYLPALSDRNGQVHGLSDGHATARLRVGGLQSVEAVGTGCMLVRRAVFETLPRPWFRCDGPGPDAGHNEDMNFCDDARRAGFPVMVDTDLVVGHLTVVAMTPAVHAGISPEAFTYGDGATAGSV